MEILDKYRSLLTSVGLRVTEGDFVVLPVKNESPVKVGGKEVVVPSKVYLDQNDWTKYHPFHPLCEDALMGQSPTIHLLQNAMNICLTSRYTALLSDIFTVVNDNDLAKTVASQKANELVSVYPEMKPTVIASWTAIRSVFTSDPTKRFVSLVMSRSQQIDGTTYLRTGTSYCPLTEDRSDVGLLGAKISKKDTGGIRSIVSRILEPVPTIYKSNANAPYFDVLCQWFIAHANRYNEILGYFGKTISSEPIDISWEFSEDDYARLSRRIPPLPGNAGAKLVEPKRGAGDPDDTELGGNKSPIDVDDEPPFDVADEADDADKPTRRKGKSGGKSWRDVADEADDDDDDDRRSRRRGRDRSRDRDRDRRDRRGRDRDRDHDRRDRRDRGRDRDRSRDRGKRSWADVARGR